MLKIPKGLKKKKKGKKKKDQELFTEEELEQYKAEKAKKEAEAAAAAAAAAASGTQPTENTGDKEEWSKFAQLTSGVDSIVKKTQDDLTRIKETSFFQRIAPKIEETKPEEPEEDEETRKERELKMLQEAVVELSESEYESDEDTSVFDTEYNVTELPLTIIPDSPEFEQPDGDDPFDTSYADKVITDPTVIAKAGKKPVTLGSEVLQVLTGTVDNLPKVVKKPRRRGIQNLLMESFEVEEPNPDAPPKEPTPEHANDPLDSIFELPLDEKQNVEINLSVNIMEQYLKDKPKVEQEKLDDFEEIKEDEEDDEFAQLAAESLTKPADAVTVIEEVIPSVVVPPPPEQTDWAEFEPEPINLDDFDIEIDENDDPFNTEFAEALTRVDSFEQLAMESLATKKEVVFRQPEINLMGDDDNPTIEVTGTTDEIKREELARRKSSLSLSINPAKAVSFAVPTPDPMKSDIEFSALIRKPLTPYHVAGESEEANVSDVDPFDTSFVPDTAPSKVELTIIEQDLLKTTIDALEDDDFDPRAVTPEPPEIIAQTEPEPVKIQEPDDPFGQAIFEEDKYSALALADGATKTIEPDSNTLDILTTTDDANKVATKVLTPQLNSMDSFEVPDIDPFDTSFADVKPGQAEIKAIESELIQ